MKKKKKKAAKNSLQVNRICVFPLTDCCGLKLHFKAEVANCRDPEQVTVREEVSETGYVVVSSFLTQRSEISTKHSLYRVRYPGLCVVSSSLCIT